MKALVLWVLLAISVGLLFISSGCGAASHADDNFVSSRSDLVTKTEVEWKAALTAEEYRILRQKGTERAFTGKYWNHKESGNYHCAACGLALFSSDTKFKSGTGWPSYTQPIAEDRLSEAVDGALGMKRTEILCNRCGGHLGHVFPDGPPPTGLRYCVNGTALDFTPAAK